MNIKMRKKGKTKLLHVFILLFRYWVFCPLAIWGGPVLLERLSTFLLIMPSLPPQKKY